MSTDIKTVVAELEQGLARVEFTYDEIKMAEAAYMALPSLLAELRRCWAIVEAAVSLREARNQDKFAGTDGYNPFQTTPSANT